VHCPKGDLWSGAACYNGQDINHAQYYIGVPANWNGGLALYGPGGPAKVSAGSQAVDPVQASFVFAEFLPRRYAVAITAYSRQGWAIGCNALDIETLRRIFIKKFGQTSRTIVFGGSYAGEVVAKVIEKYGVNADGSRN
jgi:hypothetical protein